MRNSADQPLHPIASSDDESEMGGIMKWTRLTLEEQKEHFKQKLADLYSQLVCRYHQCFRKKRKRTRMWLCWEVLQQNTEWWRNTLLNTRLNFLMTRSHGLGWWKFHLVTVAFMHGWITSCSWLAAVPSSWHSWLIFLHLPLSFPLPSRFGPLPSSFSLLLSFSCSCSPTNFPPYLLYLCLRYTTGLWYIHRLIPLYVLRTT